MGKVMVLEQQLPAGIILTHHQPHMVADAVRDAPGD